MSSPANNEQCLALKNCLRSDDCMVHCAKACAPVVAIAATVAGIALCIWAINIISEPVSVFGNGNAKDGPAVIGFLVGLCCFTVPLAECLLWCGIGSGSSVGRRYLVLEV